MSKLTPTIVTQATIGDAAFDGTRRRPVVAINDKGELVVCCRSTARKHGWKMEGALFQRNRTAKVEAVAATPKPAKMTAKHAGRRETDPVVASVEELLATTKK